MATTKIFIIGPRESEAMASLKPKGLDWLKNTIKARLVKEGFTVKDIRRTERDGDLLIELDED